MRKITRTIRRLVVGIAVAFTALSVTAGMAYADDPPASPAGPVKLNDTLASVQISATLVNLLISGFIPLVTGFLTKSTWRFKGLVTLLLASISSLVVTATLADGTAVVSQQSALNALVGFMGAVATYAAVWKSAGVTSTGGSLADKGVK
jgi:hypothetical protein